MGDMREYSSCLEKEIQGLLVDKRSLKESIVNLKWNSIQEGALLEKSKERMAKHSDSVEMFFKDSEISREIEDETRQVKDLKKICKFVITLFFYINNLFFGIRPKRCLTKLGKVPQKVV